jgi:hypothetical protein
MALFSPVLGPRNVTFPAVLMEYVLAVLWGLTFGGYALVLSPEGTVFWAPYYYRNVFRMSLPWFLVGGAMICVRRLTGGPSR